MAQTEEPSDSNEAPERVRSRIRKHGPTGSLVQSLQRYTALGWILFSFTALAFVGYVFIERATPEPVVAVNKRGEVLGTFEYFDGSSRSNEQLKRAAAHFAGNYLSLNSATVYHDIAAAMTMMCDELRNKKMKEMATTNYINRVETASNVAHIEIGEEANQPEPTVLRRRDDRASVRVAGAITVGRKNPETRRFEMVLGMNIIPRGKLGTFGVEVCDITRRSDQANTTQTSEGS
jgi:hypothetical protein